MKLKKNIAISESGFVFNPEIGTSFTTNSLGVAILKQLKTKTSWQYPTLLLPTEINPIRMYGFNRKVKRTIITRTGKVNYIKNI